MARWHKPKDVNVVFLTANVFRRVRLFEEAGHCRLLLESLDYCREKHHLSIYAFVIMPDHLHLLVGLPRDGVLTEFLREWKGFVGRSLVQLLRRQGRNDWLEQMKVPGATRRKDARFHIFQPDTNVEGIVSERFFKQKLDYIHRNPVVARLVEREVDYRFSSARNWLLNDHSVFRTDPLGAQTGSPAAEAAGLNQ